MLVKRKISGVIMLFLITILLFIGCDKMGEEFTTANEPTDVQQSLLKSGFAIGLSGNPDIIVNTTSDETDFGGSQQISDLPGPDGLVTLREAMIAANNTSGAQLIAFNIPTDDPGLEDGVFTIRPSSNLPELSDDGTFIDGSTQTIFSGNTNEIGPEIKIDFSLQGPGIGFHILSSFNIIHSIIICNANDSGIAILGPNANFNKISGCFITGNGSGLPEGLDGIVLNKGASYNIIGGTSINDRNIISGNMRNGIVITLDPSSPDITTGNTVIGNFIGTDYTGTKSLPNECGMAIVGSSNNIIGGDKIGEGNLISGNNFMGLTIRECSGNRITGNLVGTDVTGKIALGNNNSGVELREGSFKNIIERNVISSNSEFGILFWKAYSNSIIGNLIGTDITGTKALGNRRGIGLWTYSYNNNIGGTRKIERNLISANREAGIQMGDHIYDNKIIGNYIGTDISGQPALGNGTTGIGIFQNSTNNIIGGSEKNSGNLIAGNNGPGIRMDPNNDPPCTGIRISRNMIYSNNGLGIDINMDGVNPNDPGDTDIGNNNMMNYPVLTDAKVTNGSLVVKGIIDTQNPKMVTIEFFANPVPNPGGDPSGYGEGAIYLGSYQPNNQGKINATLPTVIPGTLITATATDMNGNTSEFSAYIEAR
jgi:parallel beta-helix repeat protein